PLDVIKEWQSILPVIKSAPFNDVVLNEIYTLISSEYEGNIYVESNNLATIALLILMVKHFSYCRRKIILEQPLETIETLKQYELHQWIEVTNTPNEYLYLICFSEESKQLRLHPMGSIIFDNNIVSNQNDSTSKNLNKFKINKKNIKLLASPLLCSNDILALHHFIKQLPKLNTYNITFISDDPGMFIEQFLSIIQKVHPQASVMPTIISPYFLDRFKTTYQNKYSLVQNMWFQHKQVCLQSKQEIIFIDSLMYDDVISPNLISIQKYIDENSFIFINHVYNCELLKNESNKFIQSYNFPKSLIHITQLFDDLSSTFKEINQPNLLPYTSLPNTHFLINCPSKIRCVTV
ncbi:MAG: hypothetical protein VXX85_00875, partial [Candidatus Margulisiibacteriota bacterium]|nr:hypothetical protein [Candidatus Margulisiibacteriota bacterium]